MPEGELTLLAPRKRGWRYFLNHRQGEFFILSNEEARNNKLMVTAVANLTPENWQTFIPHNPDLGGSARLPPPDAAGAILLIRLYTVPLADAPYKISIRQGNRMVTEVLVAQAESRLLRGLVYAGDGEIFVEHYALRGRPLAIEWNLRISVLQMLSLADGA